MASSSSSSLGRIRYGSIMKSSSSSSSGRLFYRNRIYFKFNQQQKQMKRIVVAQGCSTRRDVVSTTSSSSSSYTTNAYSVFGTELQQPRQYNNAVVVREIKVGVDGDEEEEEEEEEEVLPHISADKLDEWLTFSVPEIVKNIGDAPLLVHIYSSMSKGVRGISSIGSSSSSPVASKPIPIIEKTKADAKSWTGVTKRWEEGSQIPDGIILVEQLEAEDESAYDMSSSSTKTWGVVIQGRGVESASSCYILKTCRVGFCTHFCLSRAKCFGESADLQLKNSWLLGH